MPFETDLNDFSGICRLFPLGEFVLLPHAVVPLHIFEPRYRQMTEHALASDRLVTIVRSKHSSAENSSAKPLLESIGCVGRILRCKRLHDGRFQFLLLGCRRVRLDREFEEDGILYRQARGELLEDLDSPAILADSLEELKRLFQRYAGRRHDPNDETKVILSGALEAGILTDLIGHALPLPSAIKQSLLEDVSIFNRMNTLLDILRSAVSRSGSFPPEFSDN